MPNWEYIASVPADEPGLETTYTGLLVLDTEEVAEATERVYEHLELEEDVYRDDIVRIQVLTVTDAYVRKWY